MPSALAAYRSHLAALLSVTVLTAGCSRSPSGNIRIDGSSTVFPISEAMAEAFGDVEPDVRIPVSQNGTSAGMGKFLLKENDICDASRPIKEEEKQRAKEAGINFVEFTVAFDGLAVVVNPQNDWCNSITVDELKTMWRPEAEGEITNWNQINAEWPDVPLKLFGAGTASGTFEYFNEAICGGAKASRGDYTASEDDNMTVRGVAGEKGALGYFGYAYYAQNKEKLKLVAIDNGDGLVTPSPDTVLDGSYAPLSRPLFIYVNVESMKRPEVKTFVKFYLDHAAEMADEVGYVSVTKEIAEKNDAALQAVLDE